MYRETYFCDICIRLKSRTAATRRAKSSILSCGQNKCAKINEYQINMRIWSRLIISCDLTSLPPEVIFIYLFIYFNTASCVKTAKRIFSVAALLFRAGPVSSRRCVLSPVTSARFISPLVLINVARWSSASSPRSNICPSHNRGVLDVVNLRQGKHEGF